MQSNRSLGRWLAGSWTWAVLAATAQAATVEIQMPLKRTAYQTNERIDLAVVRSDAQALAAGELAVTLTGDDASRMRFAFPVAAAAVQGKDARATEHVHLNGRLLRPGQYTVAVSVNGATTNAAFRVFSHVRRSSFKLINWGRAKGSQQLLQGEEDLGFNLFYGHYADDAEAGFIQAGVDVMGCCVMSGGHQMDLRMECDWSDPYVTRGGSQRVARKALEDRARPNVPGVHFYDEPGLTWFKNPETGLSTPHEVPAQLRSYASAFGTLPPVSHKMDPINPAQVAAWKHWALWKLGFMDAAWKESAFAVSQVRADYLSLTQSQYGWSAFTDGYYFNVVRSLPIISGHGGYHDFGLNYFNPSWFLEMSRARDFTRPNWYLPTWYGNTTPDEFRLEQYLSFQTAIQGMLSPPDLEPAVNPNGRQGIVESNHLMARLGTIFTTMEVTRGPLAILYSISDLIDAQSRDRTRNYSHDTPQGKDVSWVYLAAKMIQQPVTVVTDEDLVDGTVLANHKAVVLPAINYLDPAVAQALEEFAAAGGLVLKSGNGTVNIKGAVDLGVQSKLPDEARPDYQQAVQEKKWADLAKYQTMAKFFQGAEPLAQALKGQLNKAGLQPTVTCDQTGITATVQGAGDVDYVFLVNATPDADSPDRNGMKSTTASVAFPTAGRTVYDAIHGSPATALMPAKDAVSAKLRFGPGQMRVYARTAAPVGGVRVATPVVSRDLTRTADPLKISLAASVVDAKGGVLSGSIPLRIAVTSPLGDTRYTLFRATRQGLIDLTLPLAANDPAGVWKVTVRELLSQTEGSAAFELKQPARCGALAGTTRRAVMLPGESDNLFRFARLYRDITVVKGASDFNQAAAERIQKALAPWGVRCTIVNAADVNKPQPLTAEQAATWTGIQFGQAKEGDQNLPAMSGFALPGPTVLLGTPADNPLIKFLADQKVLPYAPVDGAFPGARRGLVTWQRDILAKGIESVTLIAFDADGMAEAAGSFYEAVAGIEPLTPWAMAVANAVEPATTAVVVPELKPAWNVVLPDRVDLLASESGALTVVTHDGTLSSVSAAGKLGSQKVLDTADQKARMEAAPKPDAAALAAAQKSADPRRLVKLVAASPSGTAVAYWGGRLEVRDAQNVVTSSQMMPQDVTALVWQGVNWVVGDADGRLIALAPR